MAALLRVVFVITYLVAECVCFGFFRESSSHGKLQEREMSYTSPPYYPTPLGGWINDWAAAYGSAYAVVSNMTLAEKVSDRELISSASFLLTFLLG